MSKMAPGMVGVIQYTLVALEKGESRSLSYNRLLLCQSNPLTPEACKRAQVVVNIDEFNKLGICHSRKWLQLWLEVDFRFDFYPKEGLSTLWNAGILHSGFRCGCHWELELLWVSCSTFVIALFSAMEGDLLWMIIWWGRFHWSTCMMITMYLYMLRGFSDWSPFSRFVLL